MVKFRYIISLLFVTIFISCNTAQTQQKYIDYKRISEYFELDVMLSQDTIVLGNEISITVIFKNKTDSSVYFHPEALLYIDRYLPPNIFTSGNLTTYYFSKYDNIYNLVLLVPGTSFSKTYTLTMKEPLVRFGKNKLVIKYVCSPKIREQEESKKYEILYGGLSSPEFEIFVKE